MAAQEYAGIMRVHGLRVADHRYGSRQNEVILAVSTHMSVAAPEIWPRFFLAMNGVARGEPYIDPTDGRDGERFDGRLYDVRALDVVRSRYPRVTWTAQRLPAGDDITTAAVALFGCVDGECVAIVAACKPEGDPR